MTDRELREREFWIALRAALLAIVSAIEKWQKIGRYNIHDDIVGNAK